MSVVFWSFCCGRLLTLPNDSGLLWRLSNPSCLMHQGCNNGYCMRTFRWIGFTFIGKMHTLNFHIPNIRPFLLSKGNYHGSWFWCTVFHNSFSSRSPATSKIRFVNQWSSLTRPQVIGNAYSRYLICIKRSLTVNGFLNQIPTLSEPNRISDSSQANTREYQRYLLERWVSRFARGNLLFWVATRQFWIRGLSRKNTLLGLNDLDMCCVINSGHCA